MYNKQNLFRAAITPTLAIYTCSIGCAANSESDFNTRFYSETNIKTFRDKCNTLLMFKSVDMALR